VLLQVREEKWLPHTFRQYGAASCVQNLGGNAQRVENISVMVRRNNIDIALQEQPV